MLWFLYTITKQSLPCGCPVHHARREWYKVCRGARPLPSVHYMETGLERNGGQHSRTLLSLDLCLNSGGERGCTWERGCSLLLSVGGSGNRGQAGRLQQREVTRRWRAGGRELNWKYCPKIHFCILDWRKGVKMALAFFYETKVGHVVQRVACREAKSAAPRRLSGKGHFRLTVFKGPEGSRPSL